MKLSLLFYDGLLDVVHSHALLKVWTNDCYYKNIEKHVDPEYWIMNDFQVKFIWSIFFFFFT